MQDSDRLQQLVDIGTRHNLEGVKDFKRQGGRVVGLVAAHIPEEILYAAGILPWHVIGTQKESTPLAGVHRSPMTDAFTTHVAEAVLNDELSFLDDMIVTNYDDDTKALEHLARFYHKPVCWLEVPINASEFAVQKYAGNLANMRTAIERKFGTKITDEKLGDAIKEYNRTREVLHQLYEMRKRQNPPITGSETWALVAAAMSMPQRDFVSHLEPLLSHIEQRRSSDPDERVRVLLSSDFLHDVGYIKVIEDIGGVVVMDDLDMGSRYFWDIVDEGDSDPLRALARRYLSPTSSPRMDAWDRQVDQVVEWVKDFKVDGLIEMPVLQSLSRLFRSEYFHRTLEEEGISSTDIQREYHLANIAQITTRVEAFLEMVSQRRVMAD